MVKFLKRRWYIILGLILIIGFLIYRNSAVSNDKSKESKYTIKKQNLKETLTLSGQIDADEKAALKFQTSGRLAWVGVKEGDYVNKYQTVASLDQRDLKNRLTKYLNTYAVQRNTFEQTKDDNWNDQYALSQSIRDEAKRVLENNQYNLNNSILDVEYQNITMDYANLWTPIEGIVTHIDTPYAGVNITPAGAEFDVVNPNTIYFSVTADQTDVVNLKNGEEGVISFDSYPEKTYKGEIDYISYTPKTNETGTVYEVRIKLDNDVKDLPLKLGMTGDIDFLIKEKNSVYSVPSGYIKSDSKGKYVFIKVGGKKIKKYINVGEEIDGKTVIINGASQGDVVYD